MDEQQAIDYLDSLGEKRLLMTMNEVELTKLVLKYKKRIKKIIELIENDYFEDGSFENYNEVMRLLRGEDNE